MLYLIAEIALYLLLALLLGFALGWWAQTLYHRKQIERLERTWKINVSSLDPHILPPDSTSPKS
ncbi:MAG TPA: hypothetical protein PKW76_16980 [bacterium]|jgi:hypothetical protein|nr:hypothetical protein [bacterium]HOX87688.1 hypothetical protein [bacterium]HPG47365.1 hypothetical protein [bacterium]HPM99717.1 hypothetical protein [bacterium]